MTRFINQTVSRLVVLGAVTENDRDIYEYGLFLLTSMAVNLIITVAVGVIFGLPLEMILMFVPFSVLRLVSGGFHANSFVGCIVVSTLSIVAAIASIRLEHSVLASYITLALLACSVSVVFILAPFEHPNRPLCCMEVHRFRLLSRVVICVATAAAVVLLILRFPHYGFSISIGVTLSRAATLVAVLSEGGVHSEKS